MRLLFCWRAALVASTTAVAASPAIASAGVSRIEGTVDCGIIAAEPVEDAAGGKIAAVGPEAAARRTAISPAALESARNKSATYPRPQFRMPPSRSSSFLLASNRQIAPICAPQKEPVSAPHSSPNVAVPFIDHSSEMWNFYRNGFLDPLSRS